MLQLKKKALALGMAALLLLPGTVYGQSSEPVETDWKDCFTQFFQFLEDWGISRLAVRDLVAVKVIYGNAGGVYECEAVVEAVVGKLIVIPG